jgi:coatomer protein complex subunit gamma
LHTLVPSSFRYPDEYVLEDLDLTVADFVQRTMKANFGAAWEEIGATNELEDTYALSNMKTLEEAVKNILQFLGLQPCERSDKVPEGKSSHTLVMAGVFRGGHEILVRAKLALSDGVTMQLTVRSENADVSELITSTVG